MTSLDDDYQVPFDIHTPEQYCTEHALSFEVLAKTKKARCSRLVLPHVSLETPIFMPVGTQGTIKGLLSHQLNENGLEVPIILGNTYHLAQRPGPSIMKKAGGLHKFMNWNRGILTDSGGFQMVSLLSLANIDERGVEFQSPHDGRKMLLTPEQSMYVQNCIGGDIIMALDDVVNPVSTKPERIEEAMYRTIRWIDRCIAAHKHPKTQNLFGIVQGGLNPEWRKYCAKELIKRNLPGYAIGGLSGGEDKNEFWKVVNLCTDLLPEQKPRYCMGIGYAEDLVVCVALGVDMFDCVYPCRTARFGTALITKEGTVQFKKQKHRHDFTPIDSRISSFANNYTRSFLQGSTNTTVGCNLMTIQNIAHHMNLMKEMREAIKQNVFEKWVKDFMQQVYPKANYPSWISESLSTVGIHL